ncbi:snRNA-activating protein complex subunit 3-like [Dreissena polymorpha]|uniref:snRNA-activating protein complex subunit 3 n=1 Tax=Dreissena polymorpha TaxID=45954 RepID=A0A9D4KCW7_DREPO|nr:snRNA-activating protein complex subunit 3-like [Dreissena polymorpha]KAH3837012.1 hypothetical protein DPMN_110390 [Dreissena polymorpha]
MAKRYGFDISETINIREFLSKWDNALYLSCAQEPIKSPEMIAKAMNMSIENVKELETVCSLDQLNKPGTTVQSRWESLVEIPDDVNLFCTRFQAQELERRSNKNYNLQVMRKFKYKMYDQYPTTNLSGIMLNSDRDVPEECQVIYPDVVITAHIHRGVKTFIKEREEEAHGKLEQLLLTNTMLVLGRQKLTDLRDVIRCANDLVIAGDASENPDVESQEYAKDIFKSGLFFIHNTFYNDLREQDCRDYSQVIRDWGAGQGRNMGPYEVKKMEDVTFLDLTLQLGRPYLYLHQGDCEHIIIFSDIRLLTKEHSQDVREYPYLLNKCRRARTLCRVCSKQAARWITYGSEFAPENPCFFCDVCFRALHYDENNKKVSRFEAYRFFDHHAVV